MPIRHCTVEANKLPILSPRGGLGNLAPRPFRASTPTLQRAAQALMWQGNVRRAEVPSTAPMFQALPCSGVCGVTHGAIVARQRDPANRAAGYQEASGLQRPSEARCALGASMRRASMSARRGGRSDAACLRLRGELGADVLALQATRLAVGGALSVIGFFESAMGLGHGGISYCWTTQPPRGPGNPLSYHLMAGEGRTPAARFAADEE